MIIESLDLKNYRNYDVLNVTFDKNINIFYGDNAQGKTNILESIYMGATSKPHRNAKDREVIRFGCEEAHIKINIDKNSIKYRIDIHLKKDKKKGIAINGTPIRRASDLLGILNVVIFSPEDLNIIKEGPSQRRRFIDMEMCQLSKGYLYNLTNYNKVLMQRNKLLKELSYSNINKNTLEMWNIQLVKYGNEIIKERKKFIDDLNDKICDIHSNLTDHKENLVISYDPNVKEDNFYDELISSIDRDIKYKSTNIGPHRDDISFMIHDIDVRKYGSQGQQRTVALSLKLSEIELVKQKIGENPILLLDDVLSELDSNRQNLLLNNIKDIQTLITCTGIDEFVKNRFNINKTFNVVNGTIV